MAAGQGHRTLLGLFTQQRIIFDFPSDQVSVGFADNSSSSPNFPFPWNSSNSQISFVGGGTAYRADAIRLDNLDVLT